MRKHSPNLLRNAYAIHAPRGHRIQLCLWNMCSYPYECQHIFQVIQRHVEPLCSKTETYMISMLCDKTCRDQHGRDQLVMYARKSTFGANKWMHKLQMIDGVHQSKGYACIVKYHICTCLMTCYYDVNHWVFIVALGMSVLLLWWLV